MRIEVVTQANSECDTFVRRLRGGRLCHLQDWGRMIQRTYGHEVFHMVAFDDDTILGLLPLTLIRSRLFGVRMVSQAFSNYGGPLIDDERALGPLLRYAYDLAQERRCRQIEFRSEYPLSAAHHCRTDKVCMHLPLSPDPDAVWRELRSEIRNRVRKAEKAGLTVEEGGGELLADFYEVWTIRMLQLGTPCYSRRFFRGLFDQFSQYMRIFLVRQGTRTIGAGLFYRFNGLAQCRWAATLTESNPLSPNMLLYWAAIKYYCLHGTATFDFGRSTQNSTQHEFKRRWGAQTVPLYYEHWTPREYPLDLTTPDSPRYRKKVEMWRRLPLWATRLVGPCISRSLP